MISEEQKAKLIDKYRDINVDSNHWNADMEEDFKDELREKFSFNAGEVCWSGFCSQGDGALFSGYFEDPFKVIENDKYPVLRKLNELDGLSMAVGRHTSRYSHSGNMFVSTDMRSFHQTTMGEYDSELQAAVCSAHDNEAEREIGALEEELLQWARDKADEFYRRLEDEYEHLTSDEQVWESIVANELEKELDDDE